MKYTFESLEDTFQFGKFKGYTLKEVYTGSGKVNSDLFYEFLNELHENNDFGILFPEPYSVIFEIKRFDKQRIWFKKSDLQLSKLEGFKRKEEDFLIEIRAEVFMGMLDSLPINNGNFKIVDYALKRGEDSQKIPAGSPDAIKWYIKNVDSFSINPDVLNSLFSFFTFELNNLKLSRIRNLEFSYEPYFKKEKITFPEDLIKKNSLKYEARNINHAKSDYDDRTYHRYQGSYASDNMGFSDQDIDDAFDGDPNAYWNIE